ncbi:MAG: hypothetical protein DRR19_07385, partial [Candidatus Parabeggiatoa sp. nov. 1]
MTKNTPMMVNHPIAFCWLLLCSVALVSVAHAGNENVLSPRDLDIAFATVSGEIGNSTKTAGCLIVLSTRESSTPNIYCRYELEKPGHFLRDDDSGITLSDVNLRKSTNQVAFQKNITTWFKNKYPKRFLVSNELSRIANVMSGTDNNLFGKPKTYHLPLGYLSDTTTNEQFAATVHLRLSQEKQPKTTGADDAQTVAKVAQKQAEAAIQKVEAAAKKAEMAIQKAAEQAKVVTTPDTFDMGDSKQMSFALMVAVFILALLLWFLTKRTTRQIQEVETKLETELRTTVSNLGKNIAALKDWQTTVRETTLPQHSVDIMEQQKQLGILRSEQKQFRITLGRELEDKIQQLRNESKPQWDSSALSVDSQPELARLEKSLIETQRQLRFEQAERKKVDNAL